MTYSISIFGSMQDLNDESVIEEKARELVAGLAGVNGATLTTTHGGQVNLLATTPTEPAEQ